jgi:hypothetical protein
VHFNLKEEQKKSLSLQREIADLRVAYNKQGTGATAEVARLKRRK